MPAAVQNRDEIVARIQRHAQDLRRLGVSRLGLFGSF
jgi:predicted nucleotidyltransferase